MTRRAVAVVGIILAVGWAAPAAARAPMYAYKAGVDEAVLDADEAACLADARKAMKDASFRPAYAYNPATQGTVAGVAGAGLAQGFMAGIASAKRFNTTLYDCMVGRGYSMRRMSEADWKAVKTMSPEERKAKTAVWRTGPVPVHPALVRDKID